MDFTKSEPLRELGRQILKQYFGSKPPALPTLKFESAKNDAGTIYYVAPDFDRPSGGARTLYRHVDILNSEGLSATIVHTRKGFSYSWFGHQTRIAYAKDLTIGPYDIVVVPEVYGRSIRNLPQGVRHIIFNQGAYLTFAQENVDSEATASVYLNKRDLVGIMVVSNDSLEYMQYAFPGVCVQRVHQSIDPNIFYPSKQPHGKRIAFMPRRYISDIVQVLQILRARGALQGWDLLPIHGKSPAETAELLRSAAIFLTAHHQEGFGLPPVEAMACGCLVAGFPGHGGREYLKPEWSFPVEQGDVKSLARTVEHLLTEFELNPAAMHAIAQKGMQHVRAVYSPERERNDVKAFFDSLLASDSH